MLKHAFPPWPSKMWEVAFINTNSGTYFTNYCVWKINFYRNQKGLSVKWIFLKIKITLKEKNVVSQIDQIIGFAIKPFPFLQFVAQKWNCICLFMYCQWSELIHHNKEIFDTVFKSQVRYPKLFSNCLSDWVLFLALSLKINIG